MYVNVVFNLCIKLELIIMLVIANETWVKSDLCNCLKVMFRNISIDYLKPLLFETINNTTF